MPFVRIALMKGRPAGFGKKIGEVVYGAMVNTINVPVDDHFQLITEHDRDSLIYHPNFLGIARTDGFVFVQITLNEGRTVELKKALYREIVGNLRKELGVRDEDVFINLVEVKKENWSLGGGVAQFAL